MRSLLRIVCIAAAIVTACSHARALQKTMPIELVGDWCFASRDDNDNKAWFTLPSWTESGNCTNILSINKYSFYFVSLKMHCEPEEMSLGQISAPSGTAYTATVAARCRPDGPVTEGVLQTFEFDRYKGNLTVTISKAAVTAERDMTCRGVMNEVKNTGGDNIKIGPCQFTIDQYTGVLITEKCRNGQPCTVRARVIKDSRGLWIKHAYSARLGR